MQMISTQKLYYGGLGIRPCADVERIREGQDGLAPLDDEAVLRTVRREHAMAECKRGGRMALSLRERGGGFGLDRD